jgi:hypothetical protein
MVLKALACAVAGAGAAVVVLVGAMLATCFAAALSSGGAVRAVAGVLPRPSLSLRRERVRRAPSMSTYSPAA